MYKVEFISTFYEDIQNIVSALDEYPDMAKRIFEKMDVKIRNLTKTPMMYPIYDDFPEFRKIIIEDYLMFYAVDEKNKLIEMHRLLYGRMDLKNFFKWFKHIV